MNYAMNQYDKQESVKLFSFLSEEAEKDAKELFLAPDEAPYQDAMHELSEIADCARANDFKQANDMLQKYLSTMQRNTPNFMDVNIRDVFRKGDPHYFGSVISREKRALYTLRSYLKSRVVAEDICDTYHIRVMLCGKNSMDAIYKHLGHAFPYKVKNAFRIWNEERDNQFYSLFQEGYTEQDIHYAYNATVNSAMMGIICEGMLFEDGADAGLLFGPGGYLATQAAKAASGYTSLSGSRWRNGTSDTGYLCLYKVMYKNPLHLGSHSGMGSKHFTKQSLLPYDIVWAHKGYRMGKTNALKCGEQVIYDERQVTLMYVIELGN